MIGQPPPKLRPPSRLTVTPRPDPLWELLLSLYTLQGPAAVWAARLTCGDRRELGDLGRVLAEYRRRTLRPYWTWIEKVVDDEVVARTRVLAPGVPTGW